MKGQAKLEDMEVIETKRVDSPDMGYAQYMAELATVGPARAGKIDVRVNMRSVMGGFAKFDGTEAQQQAASRFRSLWDRGQVGGARAVDTSRETVDGGYLNPEGNIISGEDARREYRRITTGLGTVDTERFEQVVNWDLSPTAYAKWRYEATSKPNERRIGNGITEIRGIADRVAEMMKLQSRRAV